MIDLFVQGELARSPCSFQFSKEIQLDSSSPCSFHSLSVKRRFSPFAHTLMSDRSKAVSSLAGSRAMQYNAKSPDASRPAETPDITVLRGRELRVPDSDDNHRPARAPAPYLRASRSGQCLPCTWLSQSVATVAATQQQWRQKVSEQGFIAHDHPTTRRNDDEGGGRKRDARTFHNFLV